MNRWMIQGKQTFRKWNTICETDLPDQVCNLVQASSLLFVKVFFILLYYIYWERNTFYFVVLHIWGKINNKIDNQ